MAHGQLLLCEDDGTETNHHVNQLQNNSKSLLPYLKKHKLPIQKFVKYGADIHDFINFNNDYFDGFCQDMKLNNLETIRFGKLLKDLNKKTNNNNDNQIINDIKSDKQIAEQSIDFLFNTLNDTLNQRKRELKVKLQEIYKQKINNINTNYAFKTHKHIEFIFPDFNYIKNKLSSVGQFVSNKNNINCKPPSFSLLIPNDNCCNIQILINDQKQNDNNISHQIEYKQNIAIDNDNDTSQWNKTCSLIISAAEHNIKPLTSYKVRVRSVLNVTNTNDNAVTIYSKWSKIQNIQTKFNCIWNDKYHGNNIKLINKNEIYIDGNSSCYCSVSIVAKYIIKKSVFKKIKFEFIMNEYSQPSMLGFVGVPIKSTMKGYWNTNNNALTSNRYSFIISVMDGIKYITRYKNGKDTENGIFSMFTNGISAPNTIKKGDHFIFDIDFDLNLCNVRINDNGHKVAVKDEATWNNIPDEIVPVYAHYCDFKLVQKNSKVKINLISKELR